MGRMHAPGKGIGIHLQHFRLCSYVLTNYRSVLRTPVPSRSSFVAQDYS